MAAFTFSEQHVRASSTPFLLPSRLSPFRKNFRKNHGDEKRWRGTRTPSSSSLRRDSRGRKTGITLLAKEEKARVLVVETSHDAEWYTRWKAVWMNDEQHREGGGRGGEEEGHVLLLLASARSVSRQWRATTVASFFLLFLAKERGRIDEAARALIAETGRLLDASSPRSGTTTLLPRRRASRCSRPNTTNDPGHTREKREASHDLRYDDGSRCDTFRDTENKAGTRGRGRKRRRRSRRKARTVRRREREREEREREEGEGGGELVACGSVETSPRRGYSVFAGGADQKREKEKGKKEKENGNAGFSSLVGRGAAMAVAWLLLLVLVVLVLLPVLLPAASLGAGETIISQHPHRAGPIRGGATAECRTKMPKKRVSQVDERGR